MFGWNVGITTALITDIQSLLDNMNKQTKLSQQFGTYNNNTTSDKLAVNDTTNKLDKELAALKLQQSVLVMNIVKNTGDWLVSFNGFEGPARLGMAQFSERTVSVAGLISGCIVSYQIYRSL